jgi:hypothetical protein
MHETLLKFHAKKTDKDIFKLTKQGSRGGLGKVVFATKEGVRLQKRRFLEK